METRSAGSLLYEAWDGILSLVYPPKCAACMQFDSAIICERCLSGFERIAGRACRVCGAEATDALPAARMDVFCGECAEGATRHFRWARAAGRFDGSLRRAIHQLKYEGRRRVGAVLGEWLAEALRTDLRVPHAPDVVVPVPLHWTRLRKRGFNQSLLIARAASEPFGWPVAPHALRRTRRTRPQVELDAEKRAANVRNAFAVAEPTVVAGKRVLIVDDVLTTMHTVDECARVAVEAGARDVYVAAVAR